MVSSSFVPSDPIQKLFAEVETRRGGDSTKLVAELTNALSATCDNDRYNALVQFPRMFDLLPFPNINKLAMIRLADGFRDGSNLIKHQILHVFLNSQPHLGCIADDLEEALSRVSPVYHSTDPISRALLLRLYGALAVVAADSKQIHHSVLTSLDSPDKQEVQAAIFAANRMCEESKTFAIALLRKVVNLMERLESPPDTKLLLIPLIGHMYHSPQMVNQARRACNELLKTYSVREFVMCILHTLTNLTLKSLIDSPTQIHLLCTYLRTDPRMCVKVLALEDLQLLCARVPYCTTVECVGVLTDVATSSPYENIQMGTLDVLIIIASMSAAHCLRTNLTVGKDRSDALSACEHMMRTTENPAMGVACARVLVTAATNEYISEGGVTYTATCTRNPPMTPSQEQEKAHKRIVGKETQLDTLRQMKIVESSLRVNLLANLNKTTCVPSDQAPPRTSDTNTDGTDTDTNADDNYSPGLSGEKCTFQNATLACLLKLFQGFPELAHTTGTAVAAHIVNRTKSTMSLSTQTITPEKKKGIDDSTGIKMNSNTANIAPPSISPSDVSSPILCRWLRSVVQCSVGSHGKSRCGEWAEEALLPLLGLLEDTSIALSGEMLRALCGLLLCGLRYKGRPTTWVQRLNSAIIGRTSTISYDDGLDLVDTLYGGSKDIRDNNCGWWTMYKIAQDAAQEGHFSLSQQLFDLLVGRVSNDKSQHWVDCLLLTSRACGYLEILRGSDTGDVATLVDVHTNTVSALNASLASLASATTHTREFAFQKEYISAMIMLAKAHLSLCALLWALPLQAPTLYIPSLITDASNAYDRVAIKMEDAARGNIDIDRESANVLQALGMGASVMGEVIRAVGCTKPPVSTLQPDAHTSTNAKAHLHTRTKLDAQTDKNVDSGMGDSTMSSSSERVSTPSTEAYGTNICTRQYTSACTHVSAMATALVPHRAQFSGSDRARYLLMASWSILRMPMGLPKYFFQSQSKVQLDITVTPIPNTANEIRVKANEPVELTVEAVLQSVAGYTSHELAVKHRIKGCQMVVELVPREKEYSATASGVFTKCMKTAVAHENTEPTIHKIRKREIFKDGYASGKFMIPAHITKVQGNLNTMDLGDESFSAKMAVEVDVVISLCLLDVDDELWRSGPRLTKTLVLI
eukprot:CFRG0614T1